MDWGIHSSSSGRGKRLFSKSSGSALGPTHPSVQWVLGRDVDHWVEEWMELCLYSPYMHSMHRHKPALPLLTWGAIAENTYSWNLTVNSRVRPKLGNFCIHVIYIVLAKDLQMLGQLQNSLCWKGSLSKYCWKKLRLRCKLFGVKAWTWNLHEQICLYCALTF